MNGQPRTVGRCGFLLVAAILLGLHGCYGTPGTATGPTDGDGTATVSWIAPTQNADGSKITDLAGYMIYYGTSPDNLAESVEVKGPRTTSYTVKNLKSGTTYYFNIVAFTARGIRGSASPTVSKAIP